MRKRVFTKSPVRENCTPGSVRGLLGNWQSYRDLTGRNPAATSLRWLSTLGNVMNALRALRSASHFDLRFLNVTVGGVQVFGSPTIPFFSLTTSNFSGTTAM